MRVHDVATRFAKQPGQFPHVPDPRSLPNAHGAYLYILTPTGMEAKAKISVRFLQRKIEEYEALKIEIEQLKTELETNNQT